MAIHRDTCKRGDRARLVLGTAQIGQLYGAANTTGMPKESDAVDLVRAAIKGGIRCIDTARAYGQAEHRIGLALAGIANAEIDVVTKLDPLMHLPAIAQAQAAVAAAEASLTISRTTLAVPKIDTLLLHRASHRTMWDGAVWQMLIKERDAGRIDKLGISVQTPQEAIAALADENVEHLQLPFNLIDRRWGDSGVIGALSNRSDVVVHVRSVLLQGLFAGTPQAQWPAIPGVASHDILARLIKLVERMHRSSLVDLCIAFARAQDWIDGIVIGMETIEQLNSNLLLFDSPPLSADEASSVRASLPELPDMLLDPAQWPRH